MYPEIGAVPKLETFVILRVLARGPSGPTKKQLKEQLGLYLWDDSIVLLKYIDMLIDVGYIGDLQGSLVLTTKGEAEFERLRLGLLRVVPLLY